MRPPWRKVIAAAICSAGLLLPSEGAWAQATSDPSAATLPAALGLPDRETLAARLERVKSNAGLPDPVRREAVEAYQAALKWLNTAQQWRQKAESHQTAAREADERLRRVHEQLQRAATRPAATAPAEGTLAELSDDLAVAEQRLEEASQQQTALETEIRRRAARRTEIPKLVSRAEQAIEQAEAALGAIPADAAPEVASARRAQHRSHVAALRAEVRSLRAESARYEVEGPLLLAQLDLQSRRIASLQQDRRGLRAAVARRRSERAEQAAREAERAAARAAKSHRALKELAERTAALARERTGPEGVLSRATQAEQELGEVKAVVERLDRQLSDLREKERLIGETPTFGVLLRKQRAELPDLPRYRRRIESREDEMSQVQVRLLDLQDLRAGLSDVEQRLERLRAKLGPEVSRSARERIATVGRQLLLDQRQTVEALIADYDAHFKTLLELDVNARAAVRRAEELATYIDERVLWIRSGALLGGQHVLMSGEALRGLFGPPALAHAGRTLWLDVRQNAAAVGPAVLAVLCLLLFRARLLRAWASPADKPGRGGDGRAGQALCAGAAAAAGAGILALPLWLIAWRLAEAPQSTLHTEALAGGLLAAGMAVFSLDLPRQLARPAGVAEAHFAWRDQHRAELRRWLHVALALLPPLVLVIAAVQQYGNDEWNNALGRIALLALLGVTALCGERLLRPSGPIVGRIAADVGSGRVWRLRRLWHGLGFVVPLLLMVLAIWGYYYTALHLTRRLYMTLWLALGLTVLWAMAGLWITALGRRLLRHAGQAAGDEGAATGTAAAQTPSGPLPAEPPAARLVRFHQHARKLLRRIVWVSLAVGLWLIWSESLPALGALRHVALWTTTEQAAGGARGAEGEAVVGAVTLADAALALLILVLGFFAARDLPGLLDTGLLQRARLDAGVRYAVVAIIRYVLSVVAVVLALGLLGVQWTNVQWLLAAMTVGLGFGLQEIFANFVSGLIILFERPVRVGDTVTIGETVGTVTRIRIRATTITDWDRKELIVPNKEFITGRLVNWSLSDQVLRMTLRVGIAYGSDTVLAEKLLGQVAKENPNVLAEPAPFVLFTGFGDNALQFELRVFIPSIDYYLSVWHEANMAIDKLFREHGITIAFPQRDTHLDTLRPLEVRVLPAEHTDDSRGT
jgi:potassium efflux system protein